LRFTEPRFLGRNLAAGFELFDVTIDFLEEAGFRQSRTGGQVTLAFPLTENTSLSTRYSLRQENIEFPQENQCASIQASQDSGAGINPQNLQLLSLCEQAGGRLSSILGYTFSWDRRNDPITPTGGFDVRFSQDLAGVGGDVKYLRTDLRANAYKGLYKNVIASATLSGGYFGLASAEVSFPVGVPNLLGSVFVEAGTVGLLDDDFKSDFVSNTNQAGVTVGDACGAIEDDGNAATFVTCQRSIDSLSLRAMLGASVFWHRVFWLLILKKLSLTLKLVNMSRDKSNLLRRLPLQKFKLN